MAMGELLFAHAPWTVGFLLSRQRDLNFLVHYASAPTMQLLVKLRLKYRQRCRWSGDDRGNPRSHPGGDGGVDNPGPLGAHEIPGPAHFGISDDSQFADVQNRS